MSAAAHPTTADSDFDPMMSADVFGEQAYPAVIKAGQIHEGHEHLMRELEGAARIEPANWLKSYFESREAREAADNANAAVSVLSEKLVAQFEGK